MKGPDFPTAALDRFEKQRNCDGEWETVDAIAPM